MKKILFITLAVMFVSSAMIARGDEFPIICKLKEDLNFESPVHVIYLKVDMKNHTVNGIPSTVLGTDIITYETDSESLTIVLPTMYITVERKGPKKTDQNIKFSGVCHRDELDF